MDRQDIPGEHKKNAPAMVRFALITVSTSRYRQFGSVDAPDQAGDISGKIMMDLLRDAGFEVAAYSLLPDDARQIAGRIREMSISDLDAVVISGGTGLAPSDVTLEAVEPLFKKTIPGFGELFRYRSFECVGPSAMLSRASAGIIGECAIFCLPGSPGAVELGLKELIIPEVSHIVKHVSHKNVMDKNETFI